MAFFDNRHWLLHHVRNSFISSDGTGMCEAVIVDDFPKETTLFSDLEMYPQGEDSDDEDQELCNSFDDHSDWDFEGYRYRGSAAQRAEKAEHEKKKTVKMKHIRWDNKRFGMTEEERSLLFQRKEIKKDKKIGRSLLSQEIEKCSLLPKNPFSVYAKFDGTCQMGVPTRTYRIFLTMLPKPERDYPVQVCILSLAKVSDLIGLTCWKFTMQNPNSNFKFRENVDDYGLYIAEDDGEVDWDFSSLDSRENVSKFFLAYLALVELTDKKKIKTENTFTPPEDDSEKISRTSEMEAAERFQIDLSAMESLLLKTFRVNMLFRMRGKAEVILSISGDKIDIIPVAKLWKQKSVISHDIRFVVSCEILELKSSGRGTFRLVNYVENDTAKSSGHCNYKNTDFEGDQTTVVEIVRKVNNIIEINCGTHRNEYLAWKRKKNSKRNNFSIWPL